MIFDSVTSRVRIAPASFFRAYLSPGDDGIHYDYNFSTLSLLTFSAWVTTNSITPDSKNV